MIQFMLTCASYADVISHTTGKSDEMPADEAYEAQRKFFDFVRDKLPHPLRFLLTREH